MSALSHDCILHVDKNIVQQPIPLDYLRLGQFDQPSETRKDKSEEGGLLDSLRVPLKGQHAQHVMYRVVRAEMHAVA